jgi:hypothetical protein
MIKRSRGWKRNEKEMKRRIYGREMINAEMKSKMI